MTMVKAREIEPGETPVMVLDNDGHELIVLCSYMAACERPATELIECGPLGEIPACGSCAAFYREMS